MTAGMKEEAEERAEEHSFHFSESVAVKVNVGRVGSKVHRW